MSWRRKPVSDLGAVTLLGSSFQILAAAIVKAQLLILISHVE